MPCNRQKACHQNRTAPASKRIEKMSMAEAGSFSANTPAATSNAWLNPSGTKNKSSLGSGLTARISMHPTNERIRTHRVERKKIGMEVVANSLTPKVVVSKIAHLGGRRVRNQIKSSACEQNCSSGTLEMSNSAHSLNCSPMSGMVWMEQIVQQVDALPERLVDIAILGRVVSKGKMNTEGKGSACPRLELPATSGRR